MKKDPTIVIIVLRGINGYFHILNSEYQFLHYYVPEKIAVRTKNDKLFLSTAPFSIDVSARLFHETCARSNDRLVHLHSCFALILYERLEPTLSLAEAEAALEVAGAKTPLE
eukprot:scaffold171816_cov38-Prasinocladus_malaysianus.AAC.1